MIVTKSPNGENVNGKHREQVAVITPGTGVSAGGELLSPAAFGMKTIFGVLELAYNTAAIAYNTKYNVTTGKLAYYNGTTELTGNQSTLGFTVKVVGY